MAKGKKKVEAPVEEPKTEYQEHMSEWESKKDIKANSAKVSKAQLGAEGHKKFDKFK